MYQQKAPPYICDRNNESFCAICISLNYTAENDRKPKISTQTSFKLFSLDDEMLFLVIGKMDTRSFARMRSTNKGISAFVEEKRDDLKIALFHTMEMSIGNLPNASRWTSESVEEPCIRLKHPAKYTSAQTESRFVENTDLNVKFSSRRTTEYGQFTHGVFTARDYIISVANSSKSCKIAKITNFAMELYISLKQWSKDPHLRRELTGIYFNYFVALMPLEQLQPLEYEEPVWIEAFFRSAKLTKIHFPTGREAVVRKYLEAVELVQPEALKIYITNTADFLQRVEFKNVKHLFILGMPNNMTLEEMENKEILEIHGKCISPDQIIIILQGWVFGKSQMREFHIETSQAVDMVDVDHLLLRSEIAEELCEEHLSWSNDQVPVYELWQYGTGKRAICVVDANFIRFKVIEN